MTLAKFSGLPLPKKLLWVIIIIVALICIYGLINIILQTKTKSGLAPQDYYESMVLDSGGINYDLAPAAAPDRDYYKADSAMPATTSDQRKIIKTGNLEILVADVDQAVSKISTESSALGGFIQNSSVTENKTGQKFASLVLRVPVTNFESLISNIKAAAKLVSREEIGGREVTEEYTDLQANLKHNEAVEAQYLELLKRANNVEEIIAVRNKLDQVQNEIERIKGRIKYLDNQTEMSTITVHISSEVKITLPADQWQPWEVIKEKIKQLLLRLQNFVNFIIGFVFFIVATIPYLLFLLIIFLLARWINKKLKSKKEII